MVVSSAGPGPVGHCSAEGQKQLNEQITNPSSRQRGRTTSRNPQLSDRNKKSDHELDTKTDWPLVVN
jgi:hypothetical protein